MQKMEDLVPKATDFFETGNASNKDKKISLRSDLQFYKQ